MPDTPLTQLAAHGQSVWIDFLSRPFVEHGDLAALVDQGVVGVTSNPTIFQGAIAAGDAYDEQLREVLKTETEPKEVFLALAVGAAAGEFALIAALKRELSTAPSRSPAPAGSRRNKTSSC